MSNDDTTTEELTATVHVVTIGTRELTLTKYRQLDHYDRGAVPYTFQPFGRVNAGSTYINDARRKVPAALEILGRNNRTGALEKIILSYEETWRMRAHSFYKQVLEDYESLPLIVLGGVK